MNNAILKLGFPISRKEKRIFFYNPTQNKKSYKYFKNNKKIKNFE